MGKGDIKIRTKNGFMETISNVYASNLESNLFKCWLVVRKKIM